MKNNYKEIFEKSVTGILEYMKNGKLESMVLGISGGIDSTVCAAICYEVARRNNSLKFYGVSLPCSTNTTGETGTADLVGKAFFEEDCFWVRSIQQEYEAIEKMTSEQVESTPISRGNIKARLRMIYLRNLAGLKKGVMIDTDNMTENLTGFFTIAGDQGDLSPIAQLWKHEVYELAEWIKGYFSEDPDKVKALENSMALTPTDGNGVKEGGDLAQIAPALSTYNQLDEILEAEMKYRENEDNFESVKKMAEKYGDEVLGQIMTRVNRTAYKRKKLPVIVPLR